MKQITAAEFKTAVELDPAWALTLTEPVEITDYCDMEGSNITHLSRLLHFTSINETGDAANFANCKRLKIAEGTFAGMVLFENSGIEKIGDLTIIQPDHFGNAATFQCCENLRVAEGTFPGGVDFSDSGVERISALTITHPDSNGTAANFAYCKHLKVAEGTFPGYVDFHASGILKVGKLQIAPGALQADFTQCDGLTLPTEFLKPGYFIESETRQKNLNRVAAGKAAAKAQRTAPDLEI